MERIVNNGKARPEERIAHAEYMKSKKNTATKSGNEKVSFEAASKFNNSIEQRIINQHHQAYLELKRLFPEVARKV